MPRRFEEAGGGARGERAADVRVGVGPRAVMLQSSRAADAYRHAYSSTSCASCGGVTPRLARRRETFSGTSWMKHSS